MGVGHSEYHWAQTHFYLVQQYLFRMSDAYYNIMSV